MSKIAIWGLIGITIVAILFFSNTIFAPPDFAPMQTSIEVPIKLADGTPSTRKMGPSAPGWVKLNHISEYVIAAVISSEDTSFFSHNGVDFHELREALKKDVEEQRFARGASTLTQQVIKNTYLTQEKTLLRKLKEVLWAYSLEKQLTKAQILTFYLNLVEWGPGIYGIEFASHHYFSTSPANLSPKQSAFLALLLPSPVRYHAYFVKRQLTPWAEQRVNHILKIMNAMTFIDEPTYQAALHESLWGEVPNSDESQDTTIVEGDLDLPIEHPPAKKGPSDVPLLETAPDPANPATEPPAPPSPGSKEGEE